MLVQPVFILTTNTQTLLICTLKRTNTDTTTGGFSIIKKFPLKYSQYVYEIIIIYFQHYSNKNSNNTAVSYSKRKKNPMEEEPLTPRTPAPGSTSLDYYHSLVRMFLRSLDCRNIMTGQYGQ